MIGFAFHFFTAEAGMSRKFREWSTDQNWLFPPSPHDWLRPNHLVYFLLEVAEQIDLSPIIDDYDSQYWDLDDATDDIEYFADNYVEPDTYTDTGTDIYT